LNIFTLTKKQKKKPNRLFPLTYRFHTNPNQNQNQTPSKSFLGDRYQQCPSSTLSSTFSSHSIHPTPGTTHPLVPKTFLVSLNYHPFPKNIIQNVVSSMSNVALNLVSKIYKKRKMASVQSRLWESKLVVLIYSFLLFSIILFAISLVFYCKASPKQDLFFFLTL
jgi:hypothetical protein